MLDIIKLRIEAGDTSLLEYMKDIQDNFETIVKNSAESERAFKKMTDRFEADLKRVNAQLEKAKNQGKNGSIIGDIITANVAQQAIGYIGQIAKAGFDISTNFEKVKVTFENAFGDKDLAKAYLDTIQQFAAKTPFEFDKLAESILKLKNRGFQPTVEELTKLGDLAATTGKEFDQLAEAVLDAQTGEFERLKEFGIRASKANGEVTLSFKGVTKTVQDNDKAVRDAIISYGSLNGVAGAMAVQSQTVAGKISNLKDSVSQLAVTIGSATAEPTKGFIDGLISVVSTVNSAIDPLKDLSRQYDEQRLKVIALDERLPTLEKRYNELSSKGINITKKEQEELNAVIVELGNLVPDAITKTDAYGNALAINASKIKELRLASKENLKLLGESTLQALDDEIAKRTKEVEVLNKAKNVVKVAAPNPFKEFSTATEDYTLKGKASVEVLTKLAQQESELNALRLQRADLQKQLTGTTNNLSKLEITTIQDYNKEKNKSFELTYANYQKIVKLREDEANANKKGEASAKSVADAEKESSDKRKKALEDLAKAYESFNDKLVKANVESLTGVARIEAERKVAQAELQEKLNLAKADSELIISSSKSTIEEKKKAQEQISKIESAGRRLGILVDAKYADQKIKFLQDDQKKTLELNEKALADKIKIIEEEGKLKELELAIAEKGNSIYTKEEQIALKRIELEQKTLQAKRDAFLEAKGLSTDNAPDAAPLDLRGLTQKELDDLRELNAKITKADQDAKEQRYNNDLAALNRKKEIDENNISLIEKSSDKQLSLEKFKEKQLLILQKEALETQIKLAKERYGEKSPEVKGLESQLNILKAKIKAFKNEDFSIDGWLQDVLGLKEEDFAKFKEQASLLFDSLKSIVDQQRELEIEQLQERQSMLDEKIRQTEDNIKKEQDLRDRGFRNNLEAEQATLNALTEEKKKAAEEEKKLRKEQLTQQLIADEISAASKIALAIASIIQWETATKGFLGIVTAGIGIVGAIALFTKYKAATKKLEDGGNLADSGFVNLRGRTDKFGGRGHRIEDSNIVVGGSEFITNEVDSQRYENVLKRVNAGKLRRKPQHEIESFVKWMDGEPLPRVTLPSVPEHQSVYIQNVMANPANKDIFSGTSQENRLLDVVKGLLKEVVDMKIEITELKNITAKRPIITPIPGGYMETVGNNTTIIKLKQNDND